MKEKDKHPLNCINTKMSMGKCRFGRRLVTSCVVILIVFSVGADLVYTVLSYNLSSIDLNEVSLIHSLYNNRIGTTAVGFRWCLYLSSQSFRTEKLMTKSCRKSVHVNEKR